MAEGKAKGMEASVNIVEGDVMTAMTVIDDANVEAQGFDYSLIDDAEARWRAQRIEQRVHKHRLNMVQEYIETGKDLIEAQAVIPHCLWQLWIQQCFNWSYPMVLMMMRAAHILGEIDFHSSGVSTRMLQVLIHGELPNQVRDEAISRIQAGELETMHDMAAFLRNHSESLAARLLRGYTRPQQLRETVRSLPALAGRLVIDVRNMQQALANSYPVPLRAPVADALQRLQERADEFSAAAEAVAPQTRRHQGRNPRRGRGRSKYRHVSWITRDSKWRAQITYDNQKFNLGTFDTEEEAARAADRKMRELYGDAARLNFPDEQS